MATIEHCLYCFEALAAHLEDRKPMTLLEVQKSWAEYTRAAEAGAETTASNTSKPAKRLPALRRIAAQNASSSSGSSTTTSSASNSTLSLDPSTPSTSLSTAPSDQEDADADADEADSSSDDDNDPLSESPLFVTWNTVTSPSHPDSHSLRGCIGTFEPQPLADGLSSYALVSALQDTRFSPVRARELPSLSVSVTLLTDFEDADDASDWELGTHGLRISFVYHGRRYGATYLPDVAVEQGWSKEETVVSLMRKAGWVGRRERWREVELKVVRYQGKKESLGYGEYKGWREWVEGRGE